ncbi:MAG TPA: NTP transferase domain-containing protein [Acidimicrobiales bacterium]|nr:NTP transferase domain-containing protein [Acidimicrobiales bacterium]
MQLVILAAGFGRRFGGLKQLAPVGPNGQAIMDYTAYAAKSCGYEGIIAIVREDIRDEIAEHIKMNWPKDLPVELVIQGPTPGTAQAVLSAAPFIHGPFGVANADDIYGEPALRALAEHFESGTSGFSSPDEVRGQHLLVAYHVMRTVLTDATVTRGLCEVDADDKLLSIEENLVSLREDGRFNAEPLISSAGKTPSILEGNEWVSMNLWGFYPSMLTILANAVENFDAAQAGRRELLLPEVVGRAVHSGDINVHVLETDERCIGVTHAEDVTIVREELIVTPKPRAIWPNSLTRGRTRE